jgi:hypothetical protein
MQKQQFAIVDTRAPMSATTYLSLFLKVDFHRHRNQILLIGHRRVGYGLISPGLHRIEVSQQSFSCGMLRKLEGRTSTSVG